MYNKIVLNTTAVPFQNDRSALTSIIRRSPVLGLIVWEYNAWDAWRLTTNGGLRFRRTKGPFGPYVFILFRNAKSSIMEILF